MLDWISANAVTTQEEALVYLKREVPGAELQQIVQCVSAAADALELMTGRRLAFRTYRDPVVVSSVNSESGGISLTDMPGTSSVEIGDDVSSPYLRPGSRVAAIPSGSVVRLDRPALETAISVEITFGSEPELHDSRTADPWVGVPSWPLYARETPVAEVFSIIEATASGTRTLDLTGIIIERETGGIYLPNDALCPGVLSVRLSYSAGLRFPSETYRGDREASVAQRATHRLASINFQDWKNAPGRRVDISLGTVSSRIDGFQIPSDIQSDIELLRRR